MTNNWISKTVETVEPESGSYVSWYSNGQVHLISWNLVWVALVAFAIGVVLRSWGEH